MNKMLQPPPAPELRACENFGGANNLEMNTPSVAPHNYAFLRLSIMD